MDRSKWPSHQCISGHTTQTTTTLSYHSTQPQPSHMCLETNPYSCEENLEKGMLLPLPCLFVHPAYFLQVPPTQLSHLAYYSVSSSIMKLWERRPRVGPRSPEETLELRDRTLGLE